MTTIFNNICKWQNKEVVCLNVILQHQIYQMNQALLDINDIPITYVSYFKDMINWNKRLSQLALKIEQSPLHTWSLEELRTLNLSLYQELKPKEYCSSYCNPVYAKSKLGTFGSTLSALYYRMKCLIGYVYKGELKHIYALNKLVLSAYELFKLGSINLNQLREVIKCDSIEHAKDNYQYQVESTMNPKKDFLTNKILSADLDDLKYLYTFGVYVSPNEEQIARFLASFTEERIKEMAIHIVKAYISGFARENKDINLRHTVGIKSILGQERLTREILYELKKNGLIGHINDIDSTEYNKQVDYDHKFDVALYLNEETTLIWLEKLKEAVYECKDFMRDYSGSLCIERFGEEPFDPIINDARFILDIEQNRYYQKFLSDYREIIETYVPEIECSFSIIAYPTPEIGENFEAIFEDICSVNSLDSAEYQSIQHGIIEVLDKGTCVHVKGKGENMTDIIVQLGILEDPIKQTNFVNCVADVNIPVGEVFTTPVLEGTKGTLHIENIYINNYRYSDLKVYFEDGMIQDFSCTNFDSIEENRRFIEENLLFPYKSLPLGEFAIGTNTLAYAVAKKHNIQDKLPTLITEKMGPHFAIGDTCFSYVEDHSIYNPLDNKEIIARTNTVSELRHTDLSKAYTNLHTDLTLPYDSLDFINIHTDDGDVIYIIRDGRFVLSGTEKLNEALE